MQDRQESAEKISGDLAEQLRALQLEKDVLERRNRQLEEAMATRLSDAKLPGALAASSGGVQEVDPSCRHLVLWLQ
jgi:hypothetical protein